MKVNASVKKMCRKCKIIKRKRVVRVICTDPRHKQRQGISERKRNGTYRRHQRSSATSTPRSA